VVLSSKLQSGSVSSSVLNGVSALSANVNNSILMKVTARKIQADGALIYNVVGTDCFPLSPPPRPHIHFFFSITQQLPAMFCCR
jgi:hypothetical protein